MRLEISCASRCRRPPIDACVFVEAMIFESYRYAREPLSQFVETTRQLCACFRRSDLGDFAAATIEERKSSDAWLLEVSGQRQPYDRHRYRKNGDYADENYSPEITHMLEGDNPEKRLSYIGTTCGAGQRNVPAAVARANTEYVPDPGSNVSK